MRGCVQQANIEGRPLLIRVNAGWFQDRYRSVTHYLPRSVTRDYHICISSHFSSLFPSTVRACVRALPLLRCVRVYCICVWSSLLFSFDSVNETRTSLWEISELRVVEFRNVGYWTNEVELENGEREGGRDGQIGMRNKAQNAHPTRCVLYATMLSPPL